MDQAGKEYMKGLSVAMVVYALVLVVTIVLLQQPLAAPLSYLVAVLPTLPIGYGMVVYRRFLGKMDEMQRQIQLVGLAFSVGFTGIIAMTWGFLELADAPKLPTILIFPMLIGFWGIGTMIAQRRYQ